MSVLYRIPAFFCMALCHVIAAYYMSEHRFSRKKFTIYSCLFTVSFICVCIYGFPREGIVRVMAYIGLLILTFPYFCIVSRDCFPKKCFLFVTYFCLLSVLDNILKLTVKVVMPHLSEPVVYFAVISLRDIGLLIVLLLYKKYVAAVFRSLMVSGKRWWNLGLIAWLFYLLQAAVSILSAETLISNALLLSFFAVISIVMCAVYAVVFSNISYMKKDAEAELIRQNAEHFSSRLSVLQSAEDTNRRLRHDMRHHMDAIAAYAKTGDNAAILAYIGEYKNEISEAAVKQYSINRTVNSILSVYAGKAEENGIDFSVRCNVTRELEVREIDLIALLGNLLENALHGCQESGKKSKRIEIHIRLQNKRLILLCNNTCPDDLELADGLPAKKSIGISSILSVCRKYDGNLDYRIENETCSACAVLNL